MTSLVKVEAFASCELKPDFVSRRIMGFLFGRKRAKSLVDVWSHVGLIATFADGSEFVYDMTGIGVDKTPLADMLKDHSLPRRIDLTNKIQIPVASPLDYANGWLDGRKGGEYSWSQYVLYFLPKWATIIPRLISNGREKGVCSEFLLDFCVDHGIISKGLFENVDKVDPKMIIEALEVVATPRLPRGLGQQ